jgi:hypothetical protein
MSAAWQQPRFCQLATHRYRATRHAWSIRIGCEISKDRSLSTRDRSPADTRFKNSGAHATVARGELQGDQPASNRQAGRLKHVTRRGPNSRAAARVWRCLQCKLCIGRGCPASGVARARAQRQATAAEHSGRIQTQQLAAGAATAAAARTTKKRNTLCGAMPRSAAASHGPPWQNPPERHADSLGVRTKGPGPSAHPSTGQHASPPEKEGARDEQRGVTGVTGGRPNGRRVGHKWSGGGEGTGRSDSGAAACAADSWVAAGSPKTGTLIGRRAPSQAGHKAVLQRDARRHRLSRFPSVIRSRPEVCRSPAQLLQPQGRTAAAA